MSYLGLTPSEYASGEQQHRGHITKSGNRHARRLLVEAAWHYRHRPRTFARATSLAERVPPEVSARAWQAQVRLHLRHGVLAEHGKRSTVANVAIARELTGFVWATMTRTPLRGELESTAAGLPPPTRRGGAAGADPPQEPRAPTMRSRPASRATPATRAVRLPAGLVHHVSCWRVRA